MPEINNITQLEEISEDAIKSLQHCIVGQESQIQDLIKELDNYTVKSGTIIGFIGVIIALLFNQDVAINKDFIIIALVFLLVGIFFCVWMFVPQSINAHLDYGEKGPNYRSYFHYLQHRYEESYKNYHSIITLNKKRDQFIKYAVFSLFASIVILTLGFILTENKNEQDCYAKSSSSQKNLYLNSYEWRARQFKQ